MPRPRSTQSDQAMAGSESPCCCSPPSRGAAPSLRDSVEHRSGSSSPKGSGSTRNSRPGPRQAAFSGPCSAPEGQRSGNSAAPANPGATDSVPRTRRGRNRQSRTTQTASRIPRRPAAPPVPRRGRTRRQNPRPRRSPASAGQGDRRCDSGKSFSKSRGLPVPSPVSPKNSQEKPRRAEIKISTG